MKQRPKILLIGAGRFGKNHLRVLRLLEKRGKLALAGVAVKSKASEKFVKREYGVPVFKKITPALLSSVDAVDIVTPPHTHFALAKQCLRYTNVFIEKPLAEKTSDAERLNNLARSKGRVLMVGHIYRYHPLAQKLKSMLPKLKNLEKIGGAFISPIATYRGQDPLLEELHWFDVLDYLFGKKPDAVWSGGTKYLRDVYLRYPGGADAHLKIGWENGQKIRALNFVTKGGKKIVCDFERPAAAEPLKKELEAFIGALCGQKNAYPNGEVGARIVEIAERAKRHSPPKTPRVAVIGGGIFGATAALVLGRHFPVVLFEKNPDIFGEATLANQYRHHYGYHYPRSPETIKEVQEARRDFESVYREAVSSGFPSYYCVSRKGSLVSAKQFLEVCKKNNLPVKIAYPPDIFLNRNTVSVSIRTPEAVYDYKKLKGLVWRTLRQNPNIKVKLNSEIVSARLNNAGKKILVIKAKSGAKGPEEFDYVINATYARYNNFCGWLGFPLKNLNFRLKELAVVRLKTQEKCAVTIMDGPFATIVPMDGRSDLYTLGDVPLSVHKNYNNLKGLSLDKIRKLPASRWEKMKKRCSEWFPALKNSEYIKSMFVILPTEPASAGTDARPTVVASHGFGCFSIFSGKIITAVSAAKQILRELQ
ncbi:MAG: FAD-dependent oxidoreductase [Candidatus Giovannonibacteria bacterium]|nr:MAG: FAD-dependent oxidoreductase [Candidatus Giovannonibacteria bacterium]